MKKGIFLVIAGLLALAAPASAHHHRHDRGPVPCVAHIREYDAAGTLVQAALTPLSDGRYNGTVEVNVIKASDDAPKGDQTFTLNDALVRFGKGVDPANPAAGSRVRLEGTITRLPDRCETATSEPTITIQHVDIRIDDTGSPVNNK